MSRRLLLALCTAALTAASIASTSTPAQARSRAPNYPCAVASTSTWLSPPWCRHHRCRERVHRGRAFRVGGQSRSHLLVRNLATEGWIEFWTLRFAEEAYCRAAGI